MKKIIIALLAIALLNTTPVFAQQPQTLEQIVTAARNGDLPSINLMGNMHKVGNTNFGMPVNIAEAKAWFEIGASKGYAPSMFNLGLFYENGAAGIPKDIEKARAYYAQAAKLGFTRAQERLAALPPKAVSTTAPPANAIQTLNGNWYSAQWKYGYTLQNGVGVATSTNSPNFQVGQNIIQLTATAPNKFLGQQVYTDGKFYNVTATLQPDGSLYFEGDKNVKWTMTRVGAAPTATVAPVAPAQSSISKTATAVPTESLGQKNNGTFYQPKLPLKAGNIFSKQYFENQTDEVKNALEDAIDATKRDDYDKALEIWIALRNQGDPIAITQIAICKQAGKCGAKDDALAAQLYLQAAKLGYPDAMVNLGIMFNNGNGVPKNDQEAHHLFMKAAEIGHADTQMVVGNMYFVGGKLPKNETLALQWWGLAAEQGNVTAKKHILNNKDFYGKPDFNGAIWVDDKSAVIGGGAEAGKKLVSLLSEIEHTANTYASLKSNADGMLQASGFNRSTYELVRNRSESALIQARNSANAFAELWGSQPPDYKKKFTRNELTLTELVVGRDNEINRLWGVLNRNGELIRIQAPWVNGQPLILYP